MGNLTLIEANTSARLLRKLADALGERGIRSAKMPVAPAWRAAIGEIDRLREQVERLTRQRDEALGIVEETRRRSESRQRTKLVGVRLTREEHKAAAARARQLGLSIPEFLRQSAHLTKPDLSEFDCERYGGPCRDEGPIDDGESA